MPSPQRRTEQIEKIYSAEVLAEREFRKNKCMAVYLDSRILVQLVEYASRRGNDIYDVIRVIIYHRLGDIPEAGQVPESPYVYGIKLGPGKGRVIVKKVKACKS